MPEKEATSPTGAIAGLLDKNLDKIAEQSRALLLLAGIIAVAALGLVVAVPNSTVQIVGLSVFLALMLVLTGLIYLTSRVSTGGQESADHATLARAFGLINGDWWQLIVNDDSPGLSVIRVDLSALPTRHHLSGTKYGPDGKEFAAWSSRAVGLLRIDPVEVFYYWAGGYVREPGSVSGVGLFEFPGRPGVAPMTGGGWFTTGAVDRGDFSKSSRVLLRRIADDEQRTLTRGGAPKEELLQRRYNDWIKELAA